MKVPSSASTVQQHNNVQIEANEQHSEQTVIIPNQMVTRNSQSPNQTATGNNQPASQTATRSSQPANQTVSMNSKPPNQTVTGSSHLQQPRLPENDTYFRALVQQLHSGQSVLQNTQSVNAGTLNISGINNSAPFQTGQSVSINVPTVESWRDPQVYLSRIALGKSTHSYYDITDFVTGMVEEEVVVEKNGSQQVVLKSGPKKPKPENVTLAQWCVANNTILYRPVCESKLNPNNMLDYISYSTKICELVQRFTLVSVLLYDRNNRQLQAQNGFRWGTDVPHLQNVNIIPRVPRSNNNQPQMGGL